MTDLLDDLRAAFAGQYDLQRELTGGGMSRLFLAVEPTLERQVVIKTLPPDWTGEVSAARFKRESALTARLQHPNILSVLSAGEQGGVLYYVMPFVSGESLRVRLDRDGALPVAESLRLLVEVADALACAHGEGIVHRDIKPENILLQRGHALLADFGIAAALAAAEGSGAPGERLTRTGMSLGTLGYMAPEQAVAERFIDGRADVYSLGIVAYEMLAGRAPFVAENAQALLVAHLTEVATPLDDLRDDVSPALAQVVARAMAKEPESRWQTCAEFRDALQGLFSQAMTGSYVVPRRSLGTRLTRAARRFTTQTWAAVGPQAPVKKRVTVLGGAGMLVGAAAAGVLAWQGWRAVRPEELVTLAVAPFSVIEGPRTGELAMWGEGMIDILRRNLDGAGPLRVSPASLVLKAWKPQGGPGGLDRSADDLAGAAKARYVVYGQIMGTGTGVELRARVRDTQTREWVVADTTWRGATVEALADSLSNLVVADMGRRHRMGAVRSGAWYAATNALALKSFLRGEQFYRRAVWDTALTAYEESAALDSTFALPRRRIAQMQDWLPAGTAAVAVDAAMAAGRFAARLPERDRLLVTADSVGAVLTQASFVGPRPVTQLKRLFALLDSAVTRYPDDPEVWYALGEARYHHGYGRGADVTEAQALAAFDRAIALDSSFAPSYEHAIELALADPIAGADRARGYTRAFLALQPKARREDVKGGVIRVVDALLQPGGDGAAILDSVPVGSLLGAWVATKRWNDTAQSAFKVLRAWEKRLVPGSADFARDSNTLNSWLPQQLAYRGRLAESYQYVGDNPFRLYIELAMLGAIPAARVDSAARAWLADTARPARARLAFARYALPWWAQRNDVRAIEGYRALATTARADTSLRARRGLAYDDAAIGAYLLLLRRDTVAALQRFSVISDTLCEGCFLDRVTEARLLRTRGRAGLLRADTVLRQRLFTTLSLSEHLLNVERAEVAAQLGQADDARRAAAAVVAAWARGESHVTAYVDRARRVLASLPTR